MLVFEPVYIKVNTHIIRCIDKPGLFIFIKAHYALNDISLGCAGAFNKGFMQYTLIFTK